jgi:hypothetical protein
MGGREGVHDYDLDRLGQDNDFAVEVAGLAGV